jgi:hypothetical protein
MVAETITDTGTTTDTEIITDTGTTTVMVAETTSATAEGLGVTRIVIPAMETHTEEVTTATEHMLEATHTILALYL